MEIEKIQKQAGLIVAIMAGAIIGSSLLAKPSWMEEHRDGYSGPKHEDAKVSIHYIPPQIEQVPMPQGEGINWVNYLLPHAESDVIYFDGKIDFEVDNPELAHQFKEGDKADVTFREIYSLTFQDKKLVSKVLTGHEFIGAKPKR